MKYSSNRAAITSYFHEQKLFGRGQKLGRNLAGVPAAKISCPFRILIAGVKASRIYRRNFIWPSLRDNEIPPETVLCNTLGEIFFFFSFAYLLPDRFHSVSMEKRASIDRRLNVEYHESEYLCGVCKLRLIL